MKILWTTFQAIAAVFAFVSSVSGASAAEGRKISSYCIEGAPPPIAGFNPAEKSLTPQFRYPPTALSNWSEGWVAIEYGIDPAGVPNRLSVVDAIGSKDFVKASLTALEKWRFKPATRNGKPVGEFMRLTSVIFLFEGVGLGSDHEVFAVKYRKARALFAEKNWDGAIAQLEDALKGRTNLYEAAMGSTVLASAYVQKKQWERAQFHIRHATIEDGRFLEKSTQEFVFGSQIQIETQAGDYIAARCAYEAFQAVAPKAAAKRTDLAALIAKIDAAMKDPAPLATVGTLHTHPLSDEPATWRRALFRSKFYFNDIKGDVKSFRLSCTGTELEAPVDQEMVWTVPREAGSCFLRVTGAPDASFKLIEEH